LFAWGTVSFSLSLSVAVKISSGSSRQSTFRFPLFFEVAAREFFFLLDIFMMSPLPLAGKRGNDRHQLTLANFLIDFFVRSEFMSPPVVSRKSTLF
jgi:hypothetical protein